MTERNSYNRGKRYQGIVRWIASNGGATEEEALRFILRSSGVSLPVARLYLKEATIRGDLEQEDLMGERGYRVPHTQAGTGGTHRAEEPKRPKRHKTP